MFGRRPEGKRVKHLDPIVQITPYLMPWRCDAQVFLAYDAEYEPLLRYMSHKSREGVKITFMELISAAIKLASALLKVPLLPNLVVHVANFLDHHDLFPKALMDALPFHTSLFVTNMASIGMTRVYHHIYNFGDTTMFLSLGCPERSHAVDATGKVFRKCTLPMGMTVDERICGGAVYARLFASMKHYLKHPEELEAPPDRVYYNEGAEYHVPKPDNVALPHSVTLNA